VHLVGFTIEIMEWFFACSCQTPQ